MGCVLPIWVDSDCFDGVRVAHLGRLPDCFDGVRVALLR